MSQVVVGGGRARRHHGVWAVAGLDLVAVVIGVAVWRLGRSVVIAEPGRISEGLGVDPILIWPPLYGTSPLPFAVTAAVTLLAPLSACAVARRWPRGRRRTAFVALSVTLAALASLWTVGIIVTNLSI